MDYKEVIGVITVALTFVGYFPYIRDVVKGKTQPHLYTWLVWTLAVSIAGALQIKGDAGSGAWPTVAVAMISVVIFSLSLKRGSRDIVLQDKVFMFLALVSLLLWLVVDVPVWSNILIVATDILGFVPTVRKSWHKPYSETLSTYQITTVRHGLSIFALHQFNILTALYPIVWTLANLVFSIILISRRRVYNK